MTKRFAITLPPEARLSTDGGTVFALSPNGSDLVYIGEGEVSRQLFRRSMNRLSLGCRSDIYNSVSNLQAYHHWYVTHCFEMRKKGAELVFL
jgi:hypothetical protein